MGFDINAKENKPIPAYLSEKRALVFDAASSSRPVIRRLLSSFGVKTSNIDIAETFADAEAKVKAQSPHLIFTEFFAEGKSGMELLTAQKKLYPSSLERCFFVFSEKNSPSVASRIADDEGDGLFVRPFTFNVLQDTFGEVVKKKAMPTPYVKLIEEARTQIELGKPEESFGLLGNAKRLDPSPVLAFCYEGLAQWRMGHLEEAEAAYKQGLHFSPTHYRCLMSLFDLMMAQRRYDSAYAYGTEVWKHHPVSPNRIPDLVRISVKNRKYEDVLSYFDVFSGIDSPDGVLSIYVSAGLVVCGKFLLRNNNQEAAIAAFRKAQAASHNKVGIMREVIAALAVAGLVDVVDEFLNQMPPEVRESPEMSAAILEQQNRIGPTDKTVQVALELLKKGIHEPRIFEIAIERSIEIGRKGSAVEELIDKAKQLYPERADFFEGYRGQVS